MADFLGGLETRRLSGLVVVLLSQAIGLAALSVVALTAGQLTVPTQDVPAVVIAGISGAIGLTAFYRALSIGVMSVIAPIAATGAVVPVVVGLGGGDDPSAPQMLGIVAATAGVLLASRTVSEDSERRRRTRLSVGLALVAAVSIGTGLAAFDHAADSGVLASVLWARAVSVLLLSAVMFRLRPSTAGAGSQLKGITLIGLLDVAATSLFAVSSTRGLLSVVAVMSSLYPVVTVVLARLILREQVRPVQAAGIAFALGGVGLVAAGG